VAADKAVRDQAQDDAQRISMAGSALSLNRDVYDALAAINWKRERATKHYVERTPGYRLPVWTRIRPLATASGTARKSDAASLEFSRNIQEGGKTIEASQPSWRVCQPTT